MSNIREIAYESWAQFKGDLIRDLSGKTVFEPHHYIFRGQGDAAWPLVTSLDRWFVRFADDGRERNEIAHQVLEEFRRECERLELDADVLADESRLLALGQHHGLPTRILDWSESPYVAAFFAFSGYIENAAADETSHVAVWALNERCKVWSGDQGVTVLNVPPVGNVRLRQQFGRFTHSKTPFDSLEEFVKHAKKADDALFKITVPTTEARIAIADLEAMGIGHAHLYPEAAGAAMAARTRVALSALA